MDPDYASPRPPTRLLPPDTLKEAYSQFVEDNPYQPPAKQTKLRLGPEPIPSFGLYLTYMVTWSAAIWIPLLLFPSSKNVLLIECLGVVTLIMWLTNLGIWLARDVHTWSHNLWRH